MLLIPHNMNCQNLQQTPKNIFNELRMKKNLSIHEENKNYFSLKEPRPVQTKHKNKDDVKQNY